MRGLIVVLCLIGTGATFAGPCNDLQAPASKLYKYSRQGVPLHLLEFMVKNDTTLTRPVKLALLSALPKIQNTNSEDHFATWSAMQCERMRGDG